jgi:shikimate kinase
MTPDSRHILLLGFKHVGKSCIGWELALRLGRPFYELDAHTEGRYFQKTGRRRTCREIVADEGEDFFRILESGALVDVLKQQPGVVALGGGTPMSEQNRLLIRGQIPVHITAHQDTVRARVTTSGWPQTGRFEELWRQRDPVYRQLAQITVENTDTIENAVQRLVPLIKSNIR